MAGVARKRQRAATLVDRDDSNQLEKGQGRGSYSLPGAVWTGERGR